MVDISPAAIAEIKRLKLNRQIPDSSLRLSVEGGGCSGLFFGMRFEASAESGVAQSTNQGDRLIELPGLNLVVDDASWQYVENLQLDYSEDLMGGGFRFHNPQLSGNCGCGLSFSSLAPGE